MVDDVNGNLVHAISWRLASDLVRRHPRLAIRREFPGGGSYDCLVIRSSDGLIISLNREGRIHLQSPHAGGAEADWGPVEWIEYLAAERIDFLVRLEMASGLKPVSVLPPSTPRVLIFRLLAAIAGIHALSSPADISMGVVDSSAGSYVADWTTQFNGLGESPFIDPAGCWRLRTKDLDLVAVVGEGVLVSTRGDQLDVARTYDELGRRFSPLLGRVLLFGTS